MTNKNYSLDGKTLNIRFDHYDSNKARQTILEALQVYPLAKEIHLNYYYGLGVLDAIPETINSITIGGGAYRRNKSVHDTTSDCKSFLTNEDIDSLNRRESIHTLFISYGSSFNSESIKRLDTSRINALFIHFPMIASPKQKRKKEKIHINLKGNMLCITKNGIEDFMHTVEISLLSEQTKGISLCSGLDVEINSPLAHAQIVDLIDNNTNSITGAKNISVNLWAEREIGYKKADYQLKFNQFHKIRTLDLKWAEQIINPNSFDITNVDKIIVSENLLSGGTHFPWISENIEKVYFRSDHSKVTSMDFDNINIDRLKEYLILNNNCFNVYVKSKATKMTPQNLNNSTFEYISNNVKRVIEFMSLKENNTKSVKKNRIKI